MYSVWVSCFTHRWVGGGAPSQTIKFQEMGVDGQVMTELGGSNDDKIYS
jgi:hypothetical protein